MHLCSAFPEVRYFRMFVECQTLPGASIKGRQANRDDRAFQLTFWLLSMREGLPKGNQAPAQEHDDEGHHRQDTCGQPV